MRTRLTCRICGAADFVQYIDLTDQPPSNSFIRPDQVAAERRFPLKVYLCRACGLSQLVDVVSSRDIFDDYAYLSSTSRALCNHYRGLVAAALNRFAPPAGGLIADIGCNDGIMLNLYPGARYRLLGIEPSSAGEMARRAGFEVINEFFGAELGARLVKSHGPTAMVTTTNVFAHVDDIRDFTAGVATWLAADGIWILEFPYVVDMVEHCYFDTIYHEHLSYFGLTPLTRLFADYGLRAFQVERIEIGASGPALRLFVCRRDAAHRDHPSIATMLVTEKEWGITDPARYQAFAQRAAAVRGRILDLLASLKRCGDSIVAYCAPAKGNTLLNYLGVGPSDILAVSDNNAIKVGKVTPGSHIPVVTDEALLAIGARHALLLAWNYADFFLANSEFIKRGGRFIIPLPDPIIRP